MPVLSLLQSRRKTRRKRNWKKDTFLELLYIMCIYIYIWYIVRYIRKRHLAHWISIGCASSSDGIFVKRICNRRDDAISCIALNVWLCNRIAAKIIYHDSSDLSTIHANQSTYRILTNDCARFRVTNEMVEISFRPRYGNKEITSPLIRGLEMKIIVQRID